VSQRTRPNRTRATIPRGRRTPHHCPSRQDGQALPVRMEISSPCPGLARVDVCRQGSVETVGRVFDDHRDFVGGRALRSGVLAASSHGETGPQLNCFTAAVRFRSQEFESLEAGQRAGKRGARELSKGLSKELGPKGIRLTRVSPGWMEAEAPQRRLCCVPGITLPVSLNLASRRL